MNTDSKNRKKSRPLPVVLAFGPTAVGKTDLLVKLFAGHAEIINADSMQVYRRLDIGTAKPSDEVRRLLPHHLIDIRDPNEQFNAGDFVHSADRLVVEVWRRGKIPIVSGGTAFYFRNFIYGLPDNPGAFPHIRKHIKDEFKSLGIDEMFEEVRRVDPVTASRISAGDRYRIERALEVFRGTGTPLSEFGVPQKRRAEFNMLLLGINRERDVVYERIARRIDKMFQDGLEAEVASLIADGYVDYDPGMQGIGYREFFLMRRAGCRTVAQIKDLIKKNSRNYAKRQMTYFRKFQDASWVDPENPEVVTKLVQDFIAPYRR